MSPLSEIIAGEIRARGPITVARFMELALYHPDLGYYTAGPERAGWRGHYLTSPEIDPAFGHLWARAFEEVWERCDRPTGFEIVEIGPGEGAFAAAVLEAASGAFADALGLRLVERSPALRDRQRRRLADFHPSEHTRSSARSGESVRWSESLEDSPPTEFGCVFANEVMDNLPVHVVEARAGRILETFVDLAGSGFRAVAGAPSEGLLPWLERAGMALPDGHRAEVCLAARPFLSRAAACIRRGAVILVDYGDSAQGLAARGDGTLVCYSRTGADDAWLEDPGTKDITAHVNWTAVGSFLVSEGLDVAGPLSQRTVLRKLGLDDLLESWKRAANRARGAEVVTALSRRAALGILTDPSGLGRLDVVAGLKGIDRPDFLAGGGTR